MTMKSRLLLGLLLALPSLAQAIGLGDIHLSSALNQPLNADIELLGATPEELTQLHTGLASSEIFARYGLERPALLAGFAFKVTKDSAGRNLLTINSGESVSEPFVTFLVELSWPRGHLIREYTILLDPPVFEQKPSAAPAMAAPVTGTTAAAAAGAIERAPTQTQAAAPAEPAAPAARPSTQRSASGGDYTVVKNDSLSLIARRQGGVSAPADVNRLMIATFRANPAAFDGNINRLRRGAVLRLPPQSEWGSTDAREATLEVSRQVEAWRGGGARLRLVVPKEPSSKAPQAANGTAGTDRGPALNKDLAEARRILELKNQELARIHAQPQSQPTPLPPAPPVTKPAPPPVVTPAPVPTPPTAVTPTPAPPAPPAKPSTGATPAPEPGFFDGLSDNLLYIAIAAAVLLIGGLLGYRQMRRRRDASELDEALQPDQPQRDSSSEVDTQSLISATARPRGADAHSAIIVDESDDGSGEYEAPTMLRPPVATPAPQPRRAVVDEAPVDSRLTNESSIGLDQADPLAEADFHMAYGLYDQAADIVKQAIEREPARRDLRLKLLEVYFVWGNKDSFLEVARVLARSRDEAPAAEWDKVAIMGRQIAPDDVLFLGSGAGAAATTDIDLDLDAGGAHGMDLELLGESETPKGHAAHSGVDLDLGRALAGNDPTSETGESPTIDPDRFDLLLEGEHPDHSGATTRELMPARPDAPTVEQPMLHSSAFDEGPTIEMPAFHETDDALLDKLDTAFKHSAAVAPEATAEISLDDLGFGDDTLGNSATSIDALHHTDRSIATPREGATMIAGLDDKTRALMASADLDRTHESPRPAGADADATHEMPARQTPPAETVTLLAPRIGEVGATALMPRADRPREDFDTSKSAEIELSSSGLDLDLDELARALENDTVAQPKRDELRFSTDVFATGIHKFPATAMDLDVGAPLTDHREPTVTERMPQDLDLPELEPVTLSEVGTKLDLARAYMDMGDPDGARSILQEVLGEGSASQKVEAQRLIETLPH